MAALVENKKGFLVIAMTTSEAIHDCDFGYADNEKGEYYLICDNCNELLNVHPKKHLIVYYVAVLNRLFCDKCYKEWYARATRYNEDIPYEERYFNKYAKKLNLVIYGN